MSLVDLGINETLQTGAVRQPPLPFSRLVGAVSNCAVSTHVPTGPGGNIELPNYFLKPHTVCATFI